MKVACVRHADNYDPEWGHRHDPEWGHRHATDKEVTTQESDDDDDDDEEEEDFIFNI